MARARALHLETRPPNCSSEDGAPLHDAVVYPLRIGEETASRLALLVQFPCRHGDNRSYVFIIADQHGVALPVTFPAPMIDIRYIGENEKGPVESITIKKTIDKRDVMNARYDPDTRTMEEANKWPGRGGGNSLTRWVFRDGKFQITYFAVDATYDGEDNPQALIERDIW